MNIPIYIIADNNLTFVRSFVEQLLRFSQPIFIVDNCSSYPAMLQYYNFLENQLSNRITVIRLTQNYGTNVYMVRSDLFPELYILSNPDLLLNPAMPNNWCDSLFEISNQFEACKVGLALDISDKDKFIFGAYGKLVCKIESNYWKNKLPSDKYDLFDAEIDTTFVLINKKFLNKKQIRVAGDFTCKRLSWYDGYLQNNISHVELDYCLKNNKNSSILQYDSPTQLCEPIELIRATYGVDENMIEITDMLKFYCTEKMVHIPKELHLNFLFGDPAPGKVKTIYLHFRRGSIMAHFELQESCNHLQNSFTWQ